MFMIDALIVLKDGVQSLSILSLVEVMGGLLTVLFCVVRVGMWVRGLNAKRMERNKKIYIK